MSYYTDLQEQGQNQFVASRILDSGSEMAHCSRMNYESDPTAQAPAILCSPEETACYMCWTIGSAFEDGLSQLVQTGESDGLQAAVALTVQTYLGRNQDPGGHLLSLPTGKAILSLLDSTEPIFRHEVWLDSGHTLQLTLQRYTAVHPLVQDVLRDGQQIDMASYIAATLRYYEQHGSTCKNWEQQEALMHNSYPISIILHDQCATFILIGYDKRGRSRLGTNTRMFQEELAVVEKFGPPYYRLRAAFLFSEQEADHHDEYVKKALEEMPLFHAGVVVALGKMGTAEGTY
ncbi:MAG TPA: hypothetical protein VFA10_23720 [Ktedonobacteraceae bacterium]|nr:hypothetical protein [Ktedonobacteraceae bacterium]